MRRSCIAILISLFPSICFAQSSQNIIAPNNRGIITNGQIGNNYIFQKSEELPDKIYQDGQLIGDFFSIKRKYDKSISLSGIHIDGNLHPFEPIEVQGIKLYCPEMVIASRYPKIQVQHYNYMVSGVDVCEVIEK